MKLTSEFTITFIPYGREFLLVHGLSGDYGLDFIEDLRREYSLQHIPIGRFYVETSCSTDYKKGMSIKLEDEEVIKSIPQFRSRRNITVYVTQDGFFGSFMEPFVEVKYENSCFFGLRKRGVFCEVYFKPNLQVILRKWMEDGCPEYWPNPETVLYRDFLFLRKDGELIKFSSPSFA